MSETVQPAGDTPQEVSRRLCLPLDVILSPFQLSLLHLLCVLFWLPFNPYLSFFLLMTEY